MNKLIKIFSLLFVLSSIIACDISDEETIIQGETVAKYTYIREASPGTIKLINTSENANSYLWDFGDNTTSTVKDPVKIFQQTGEYVVTLTATNNKTKVSKTFSSTISVFIFDGGLVTNGDFEAGATPWTLGADNALPPGLVVTENGNSYFSIPVNAAGNPFDVNLSQKGLNLTQGTTYRLTFDAWSNVNRNMIVGIGLSGAPWTNQSITQNITTQVQSYTIDLVANFSSANSRVLFDLGAAVGRVNIDNVKLKPLP
jgi:PKD repeat protein